MAALTSFSVFLYLAVAFALPSGYSGGALLLFLLGIAFLVKERPQRPVNEDLNLILLFLAYTLISVVSNLAHHAPGADYDIPLRFLLVIPALILMRHRPPAPAAFWGGLATGAITSVLLSGYQITFGGQQRPGGFTNPIQFGNLSILFGLFCLAGLDWARQQRHRTRWEAFLILGAASGLLAGLLSQSRGSWIAIPVCMVIFVSRYAHVLRPQMPKIAAALALAFIAAIALIPRALLVERLEASVKEPQEYFATRKADDSVGGRIEMWRTGIDIFLEKPLTGWGLEGFMQRKKEMVAAGKADGFIMEHTHAHNELIDAAAKRGLPGLAVTLALYLYPLFIFWRKLGRNDGGRPYAMAGVLTITCYMVFGLTQAFFTHNNGAMTLAYMISILWALSQPPLQRGRGASVSEPGRARGAAHSG